MSREKGIVQHRALLICAIIVTCIAVAAPYVALTVIAGPHNAFYFAAVIAFFLVFRRTPKALARFIAVLSGIFLSVPLSTFITATNGMFIALDPIEQLARVLTESPGELAYRVLFFVGLLLLLDYLLNKLKSSHVSRGRGPGSQ